MCFSVCQADLLDASGILNPFTKTIHLLNPPPKVTCYKQLVVGLSRSLQVSGVMSSRTDPAANYVIVGVTSQQFVLGVASRQTWCHSSFSTYVMI